MNETGREQSIRYMEQLEQVTAERDRLREALSLLVSILPDDAYLDSVERKIAATARAALQEGNDE